MSLNPYCNGICSRSSRQYTLSESERDVLILIVMEYALGVPQLYVASDLITSLNPYCNGICSRRFSPSRE